MRSADRELIDDIDALVDEQLGQEASGYDHNINQVQCWHCGRDFHGLAITERLEQLRRHYLYSGDVDQELAEYRYADDASPILCLGSTAIGPARPIPQADKKVLDNFRAFLLAALREPLYPPRVPAGLTTMAARWWRLDNPSSDLEYEIQPGDRHEDDCYPPFGALPVAVTSRYCLRIGSPLRGENIDLTEDPESGDVCHVHRNDDTRRLERIEIYSNRCPTLGGTWEPITAPGGAVIPSYEYGGVVPPGTQLYTRPLGSELPPITDSSLEAHGWESIGYLSPDSQPFMPVPEIQDGDVVGYEDINTGEVITGRATVRRDGDEWNITIGDEQ